MSTHHNPPIPLWQAKLDKMYVHWAEHDVDCACVDKLFAEHTDAPSGWQSDMCKNITIQVSFAFHTSALHVCFPSR